jgi:hypothetical protein
VTVTVDLVNNRALNLLRELESFNIIRLITPVTEADYVCPFCGKTEHIPNEETLAAFEEGDAMERGEIPANQFHSFEEMWESLHK